MPILGLPLFETIYKYSRNPPNAPLLGLNMNVANMLRECAHNWLVGSDTKLKWVHMILSKMTDHFERRKNPSHIEMWDYSSRSITMLLYILKFNSS